MEVPSLFIELFGWCATTASILLFFAPVPTFWRIVQERSVGHFDSLPYLVSLLQCLLWLSYSRVTPARLPVLVSCSFGIVLQTIWCILFFRFSARSGRVAIASRVIAIVAVWFAVTLLDAIWVPYIHVSPLNAGETLQSEVMGLLADVVNVLMLGAPLGIVRHVIRTRSVEYMPFALSAMVVVSGAFWVAFAVLKHDLWVFVPNSIGLGLGVVQLVIYAIYCRSKARGEVADSKTSFSSSLICTATAPFPIIAVTEPGSP